MHFYRRADDNFRKLVFIHLFSPFCFSLRPLRPLR
jgi:hypothetical protein